MLLLSDGPLFHSMVTTPSHHTAAPTTAQLSSPLHLPQPPPICGSHISHLALYFQLVLTRQRVLTSASTGHLAQWVQNNGYWPQLFRVAQDSACFYGERISFCICFPLSCSDSCLRRRAGLVARRRGRQHSYQVPLSGHSFSFSRPP